MTDEPKLPFRSPHLMDAAHTALVVIDVQEKLIPLIEGEKKIVWNIERLLEGARVLGVRTCATEQYPKGLGGTIGKIAELLGEASAPVPEKLMFSCRECNTLFETLSNEGIFNLLLCGIETHVCVAQSALDLSAQGFNVFVCVDAVGSRNQLDHDTAIRRMEISGIVPTTTEAALFEWCEKAGTDGFRVISKLVQKAQPS